MKRTSTSPLPRSRRAIATFAAAVALSGAVAIGPTMGAAVFAQDAVATPAAQQSGDVQTTTLMTTTIGEMPAAPLTVRLLQITLQPGASVPMHTHPGPELDRVVSGTLTAKSKGTAVVHRSPDATPEDLADTSAILEKDQWILFPATVGMNLANEGQEPLVLLSAVVLPVGADAPESITYVEGTPATDAFTGVSFTVLGDGLISELPTGSADITIDRLAIPAGAELPAAAGPVMYSSISGEFAFAVDRGDAQVSRTASPGLQPNAIPNQDFTLATGDAVFFPAGVDATARTGSSGPLEVYRLEIAPAQAMTGSPAAITASTAATVSTPVAGATTTPAATSTAATPTAATGVWQPGTIVHTTTDGVNMRAEPSTSADIVNQLNANIELEVVEGPQDSDGETWYQVRLTSTDSQGDWAIGWVAKSFLAAANETPTPSATATTTPAASPAAGQGTPGASPVASPRAGTPSAAATPTALKNGDIVLVTEDRVRIRTAPTTDGDAIDVIPQDQQLRIIGGPEKANDITWYQVEYVGDETMTGWVSGEFLKLAPAADQGQ
ncbi:MAG: SH3 domain-containing protein [Thermomicrobiales bacterium]